MCGIFYVNDPHQQDTDLVNKSFYKIKFCLCFIYKFHNII